MFARLFPMFGQTHMFYRRGVIVHDLARVDPQSRDLWLGHSGGAPGAKAVVAYSLQHQAFVAVALTGRRVCGSHSKSSARHTLQCHQNVRQMKMLS
jgi:hypothetical protein